MTVKCKHAKLPEADKLKQVKLIKSDVSKFATTTETSTDRVSDIHVTVNNIIFVCLNTDY